MDTQIRNETPAPKYKHGTYHCSGGSTCDEDKHNPSIAPDSVAAAEAEDTRVLLEVEPIAEQTHDADDDNNDEVSHDENSDERKSIYR